MNIKKRFSWIFYISRRFAKVDSQGRAAASGILASAGIGTGVAALIVIMSVMNGFQAGYIRSIMEISSFHIRAVPETPLQDEDAFIQEISDYDGIKTVIPMYEAQTLAVGNYGRQKPALIRGVPADILARDSGFEDQVLISGGKFDITEDMTCVIGSTLARGLGVKTGDEINLLALSGGEETDLFSSDRKLKVTGVFNCGYSDINTTFVFVSLETAAQLLGVENPHFYGIKLDNSEADQRYVSILSDRYPDMSWESWRSYNRSFFGALKIEKNVLLMLSFLIFIVVGVNIFNSMRRMVYERREEIAVLTALGAGSIDIKSVFLLQGLATGIAGAVPGLLAGLTIAIRMEDVFVMFSSVAYKVQYFFYMIVNPEAAGYLQVNSIFLYYSRIPAEVFFSETAYITLFGIAASLAASWFASRNVLQFSVAEVLHDE